MVKKVVVLTILEWQQSERTPGEGVPTMSIDRFTCSYEVPPEHTGSVHSREKDRRAGHHWQNVSKNVLQRMCMDR
jgi:hypothetical protein